MTTGTCCDYIHERIARCLLCEEDALINILGICEDCNRKEKYASLSFHAEPWALKEVRRQHGVNGESSPSDRQLKYERGVIENVNDL